MWFVYPINPAGELKLRCFPVHYNDIRSQYESDLQILHSGNHSPAHQPNQWQHPNLLLLDLLWYFNMLSPPLLLHMWNNNWIITINLFMLFCNMFFLFIYSLYLFIFSTINVWYVFILSWNDMLYILWITGMSLFYTNLFNLWLYTFSLYFLFPNIINILFMLSIFMSNSMLYAMYLFTICRTILLLRLYSIKPDWISKNTYNSFTIFTKSEIYIKKVLLKMMTTLFCLCFELILILLLLVGSLAILIVILIAVVFYYTICRYCIYPTCMFILPTISLCLCILILSPILFLVNIIVCLNSNPIEIYNICRIYQLFYDRISYLYKK